MMVRRFAVRSLRAMGDRRGVETARHCLADRYGVVRSEAAETVTALSENPEKEWRSILATASDEHTTAMALRSLRKIDAAGIAGEMRKAAHHDSKFVRMEAAWGLAVLGQEADIQLLEELAKDKETGVRIGVAEACPKLDDAQTAVRIARPLLTDDAQAVRWAMIDRLVEIGSPQVAELYLDVLRNEEQEALRVRAANLIPNSKDITGVLEPLGRIAAKEADGRVKTALEAAVVRIEKRVQQESQKANTGFGPANGGMN